MTSHWLGTSYYPEAEEPELWKVDLDYMRSAGIRIIRVGEFAWTRLEPREGEFNVAWLTEFLDLANAREMKVVLATPTAAPPRWMQFRYPDTVAMDASGNRLPPGSRKCGNPASRRFREFSLRVVDRLIEAWGDHPSIVAWQVDNELGAWGSTKTFCAEAEARYRGWLRHKYGAVHELNRAWNAVYWSQELSDWAETALLRPRGDRVHGAAVNHAEWLDNMRFFSELTISFLAEQVALIRGRVRGARITTNLCPIHDCGIDFHRLAEKVDFCSWDNYATDWLEAAFHHDIVRNLKAGVPGFWVMEQRCGAVDSRPINPVPRPGEIAVQVRQNLVRGAEATLFFPWKPFRGGAEPDHEALCQADGQLRVDLAPEIHELATSLDSRIITGRVCAEVAIIWDMENWWSISGGAPLRIKRRHNRLDYRTILKSWHHQFTNLGMTVDLVPQDRDLSDYRLVLLPALPRIQSDLDRRLHEYASGGGTICATALFGSASESHDRLLSGLFGISASRWECLAEGCCELVIGDEIAEEASGVIQVAEMRGAIPVAHFQSRKAPRNIALSRHVVGMGTAIFCSVLMPPSGSRIAAWLLNTAGFSAAEEGPDGVERVRWRHGDGRLETLQVCHG